jgi:hypothetical protein
MPQVVECFLSKLEALSSIQSIGNGGQERERKKEREREKRIGTGRKTIIDVL